MATVPSTNKKMCFPRNRASVTPIAPICVVLAPRSQKDKIVIFSGIWRANDLLLNQSCSARERLPGRVEELDAEDLSDLSITMKAV